MAPYRRQRAQNSVPARQNSARRPRRYLAGSSSQTPVASGLKGRHISRRADQLQPAEQPRSERQERRFRRLWLDSLHLAHHLTKVEDFEVEVEEGGLQSDLSVKIITPDLTWCWHGFALRPSHAADVLSAHLVRPMMTVMSVALAASEAPRDMEPEDIEKQIDKTGKTARATQHTHIRALFVKPFVACGLTRITQILASAYEMDLHPIVRDLTDLVEPRSLDFGEPESESEAEPEEEPAVIENDYAYIARSSSPAPLRSSPAPLEEKDESGTEDDDDAEIGPGTQATQLESQAHRTNESQFQAPRPPIQSTRSQPQPVRRKMTAQSQSVVGAGVRSKSQPQSRTGASMLTRGGQSQSQVTGQKRTASDSSDEDDERTQELNRRLMFGATVGAGGIGKKMRAGKRFYASALTTSTASLTSPTPTATGATTSSTAASASPTTFDYSNDKIRGVNLGGWLLLEPWITPSIFENTGNDDIVDEYTFNTLQDADTVQSVLTKHWDTWITEDDIRQISEAGLNHVRYRASYNLFVILDLHGAIGSQNGYDNSGQRMNYPGWADSADNVNRTLDVIGWWAQQFGGDDYKNVVTMIQLMNEPSGFYPELLSVLQDYYRRAYTIIRDASPNLLIALHDGFQPLSQWSSKEHVPSVSHTIMDTHIYQIFNGPQVTMSWDEKLQATCSYGDTLASYTTKSDGFRTYVGEWTTSYTDCAKWLNGRGVGARLDGTRAGSQFVMSCDNITGTMDKFSDDYKTYMRRYFDAQTIAFERGNGWVYWNWKAEIADEWSYSKGLEGGWIPKDPTNHIYNAC
ncbi:Cellulase (glycosyl hydrolase family 5 protein) [Ceratobasidium sp. AG-Ba]|nr:Cellulase (glycosyl hydrolase family 5 protein) [Ceratobasidium sp. AG-Ba]